MEEESAAESPVASEELLLECEEDDLEPWQESPEKVSQGKRGDQEPGRGERTTELISHPSELLGVWMEHLFLHSSCPDNYV